MDSKSKPAAPASSAKRRARAGRTRQSRQRAEKARVASPLGGETGAAAMPLSPSPPPGPRRAVFVDVENTSSESDLSRIMDELEIDLTSGRTEVMAVGNWRVAGQQLGRMLAQRGAQLVHSAPAPRVPDWSDLWIAVSAGMWLGRSRPGDRIDVVSDDRAFDAIGDAATRLGVGFRRIRCRTHTTHTAENASAGDGGRMRVAEQVRTGGRRRRRGGGKTGALPAVAAKGHTVAAGAADEEPQSASQDHIRATIARLTAGDPERGVGLDALSVVLKAEGFQRPPGSPRLVTRLRRLKDVEVSASGRVRLVGAAAEIATAALAAGQVAAATAVATEGAQTSAAPSGQTDPAPKRRRARRRGGARRRRAKAARAEVQ